MCKYCKLQLAGVTGRPTPTHRLVMQPTAKTSSRPTQLCAQCKKGIDTPKCIFPNCKIYLSNLQNSKMYKLYKSQNIFVLITPNCKNLSRSNSSRRKKVWTPPKGMCMVNVFVQTAKCICSNCNQRRKPLQIRLNWASSAKRY